MNNYMILPNNTRVPLLAKDGVWEFKIDGKKWSMWAAVEQLMAYHLLYEGRFSEASKLLHANYKRLSTADIDALITYFKESHPGTYEQYSLSNIPEYATDSQRIYIANPFSYEIALNIIDERELLTILKDSSDPKSALQGWFFNYVNKYGLSPRYKADIDIQYRELAIGFCRQHGVDYWKLMYKEEEVYRRTSKKQRIKNKLKRRFIKYDLPVLKRIGWFMVGMMTALSASEHLEFGFLQGTLMFVGLAIAGWAAEPVYNALFGKRR